MLLQETCELTQSADGGWECVRRGDGCQTRFASESNCAHERCIAICRVQQTSASGLRHTLQSQFKPPGLGDRVEQWLTKAGITNRRIIAVKKYFGLKPKCGCQWRKDVLNKFGAWVANWLNKVGRYFGVGTTPPRTPPPPAPS